MFNFASNPTNYSLLAIIDLKNTILLFALALLLVSCSGNSSEQGGPPGGFGGFGNMQQRTTSVETMTVERATINRTVRTFGNIRAQDDVRITPQISERISSIHVDLGDTVSQGQLLANLRDVNFVDQVRRDEAQLEQARIAAQRDSVELSRARTLFERDLISSAEMDNARVQYQSSQSALRSAQAALTQSRENLNFTEIRSPVRGVVTRRNVSPGDVAGSGTAMFEIANLVGYEMRSFIPLADRRLVRQGQTVSIRLTGEREETATGVISRISPELDPVTGLAEVVITLTNIRQPILPGSLGEANITVLSRENTVVIPRSSMVDNVETILDPETNSIRLDRTFSAFVAVGDTVAQMRDLELGIEQGDRVEILSGLNDGERLIITGQSGLEDGGRIRVSSLSRDQQRPANRTIETGANSENTQGESRPQTEENND